MRIGFLFNHDATHQVPHTIPIAAALAARGVRVEIMTSSAAQRTVAQALLPANTAIPFIDLEVGLASRVADRLLRHVAPFRRIAILRENLGLFAQFDALVVPEITSTLLKTRFGLETRLIYLPHGAGDGEAGFQPATRAFDLVLLSGVKVRDRMLAAGLITQAGSAIVGYPKFDVVEVGTPARLFDNDRPTVLYNPHFNPRLSSWYTVGPQVLRWFASQHRFNLVFAPHVMLFKRLLHSSIIHRAARLRPAVPRAALSCVGIRVDRGSTRSIDMTYVRSADIYLGDVSSQIYEWIQRPRPAIFFDTHRPGEAQAEHTQHWGLGQVIQGLDEMPAALDRVLADPDAFSARQRTAATTTFSITDRPAGERAADAIEAFLGGRSQTAGR